MTDVQSKKIVIGRQKPPEHEPEPEQPAIADRADHLLNQDSDSDAHSKVGPSAAKRWMNCPGSVMFTKDMPDTASEYAAEGTAAHTLSEWAREQEVDCEFFLGQVIEADGFEFEVDEEMAEATQQFVDYCNGLAPPSNAYFEIRVKYDAWVPGGFGTADDVRVSADGKTLYVTDLKYGKGVDVEVVDNEQLLLYAAGFLQEYGWLYPDLRVVRLSICQPRLKNPEHWSCTVGEILAWMNDVAMPAGARVFEDDAPFKAGEWCRFCPASGFCTVRAEQVFADVSPDFDDETETKQLSADKLGYYLDRVGEIEKWCKAIKEEAVRRLEANELVVGIDGHYKLVAGRGSRSWLDEEKADKALARAGLKVDERAPRSLLTVAQAEKKIGKKHEIFTKLVKKSEGKPTLAPGSDPRPAVAAGSTDEFEALE